MKDDLEHNDDLLHELDGSPLLKHLKGKTDLKAPEGYFDRFNSHMQDLLDDEAALSETPHIQQAGKANIFKVPKNYFEELPARVLDQLGSETKVVKLWNRTTQISLAIAAAFVLIILSTSILTGTNEDPSELPGLASAVEQLTEAEMLAVANGANIDEYDLMNALSEADLQSLEEELDESWELGIELEDSDLLDELNDLDNEELELLLNEVM